MIQYDDDDCQKPASLVYARVVFNLSFT